MTNDPHSPYAPARIRGLLLPSGRVGSLRFHNFCNRLQSENWVDLGNVKPSSRLQRSTAKFSPQTATSGTIFYELSSNLPSASHLALSPFELFREPLVVIGIVDGGEYSDLHPAENKEDKDKSDVQGNQSLIHTIKNALTELKENYSKALVHYLLIFDFERTRGHSNLPENVKTIPLTTPASNSNLKEFFYEMTSLLLDEIASYLKTVQALHTVPSPPVSINLDGSVSYNGWPTSLNYNVSQAEKTKLGQLFSVSSDASAQEDMLGISTEAANTGNKRITHDEQRKMQVPPDKNDPATTFDEMTNSLSMTANLATKQKLERDVNNVELEKIPVQGFGSGSLSERARDMTQARIDSITGQLLLISGHWSEALYETAQSVIKCKFLDDYLWHAKGLEIILTCLLMQAWAGHKLKIPQLCYPESSRYSFPKPLYKLSGEDYNTAVAASFEAITLQDLALLLPNLLNMILSLYKRASSSSSEGLSQVIFSECVIRFTKLLNTLNASHGEINSDILNNLLVGQPIARSQAIAMKDSISTPKKNEIVHFLFQAMPTDTKIFQVDKIAILSGMEVALSDLQLYRKKAFVIRELISSMVPALIHARRAKAAEMGVHPAANLLALLNDAGDSQFKTKDRDADKDLEEFLRYLTRIYDIPELNVLVARPLENMSLLRRRAFSLFNSQRSGNLPIKLNVLRLCLAFCEALPNLRGINYFSALLLAMCGPCKSFNLIADKSPVDLSGEEQIHLATNISRVAGVAQSQSLHELETDYWDDFLLQDIRLSEAKHGGHSLYFHKSGNIPPADRPTNSFKNPFIFSNFSKRNKVDTVPHVIAGEECIFIAVLQNPYVFEIAVEWLGICSKGIRLISHTENITLSPLKTEKFLIKATPRDAGELVVEGCKIKIYGCRERVFQVFHDDWRPDLELRNKNVTTGAVNLGNISKKLSNNTQGSDKTLAPDMKLLRIKVVPEQPNIVIKNVSIPQAALMLLEGESKKVSITLSNISQNIGVNSLVISCSDSITTLVELMSKGKQALTPEIYEKQYLLHRRPRSNVPRAFDTLLPGQSKDCEVIFTGVIGLTEATIHINYAHLDEESSPKEDNFAKRLELPIVITVIPNIQLQEASILSLPRHSVFESQNLLQSEAEQSFTGNGRLKDLHKTIRHIFDPISDRSHGEHCMLVLDFRNWWSRPLHVSLNLMSIALPDTTTGSEIIQAVEGVVNPDYVSRLTLIIPKIYIENPHAPIPPLQPTKERQFVIKSDRSVPDVDLTDLEAFWYREKLLEVVEGSWADHTSGISGKIDLRRLRMTAELIKLLKLDDVDIEVTILKDAKDDDAKDHKNKGENGHDDNLAPQQQQQYSKVQRITATKFIVPTNNFLILSTRLYNRSSLPIHPMLRLQPSLANYAPDRALDLDRRLAFSGMMQKVLPILGPGETLVSELSFCALARGTYEIGATVEEVRRLQPSREDNDNDNDNDNDDFGGIGDRGRQSNKKRATNGERAASDAEIATKRRTWHMREMCCIVAV